MIAPSRTHAPRSIPARVLHAAIVAMVVVGLSGCVERNMSDLEAYSQQVLARKGSRIDELPPVEPYEVYAYSSTDGVDPFEPFYKEEPPPPPSAP